MTRLEEIRERMQDPLQDLTPISDREFLLSLLDEARVALEEIASVRVDGLLHWCDSEGQGPDHDEYPPCDCASVRATLAKLKGE